MAAAHPRSGGDVSVLLRGVNKTFASGVTALDGLDLAFRPGEFVSLLGPSGCGKSTALRLIAGLMEPTRGTVSWSGTGRPVGGPGSHHGEIGFVFQEPTLMPWTTVAANVRLPLVLRHQSDAATTERVAASLTQVGLGGFENSYPRELSGGMKMRVSLARALVTEPALLLMDEPFAALDEVTRFKLNDDLIALWRAARRTVIFVTHSVFESVYLSERIVVMTSRPGRVFADLPIEAPYPRDRMFRTSSDYAALCRRVSEALADATGGGGGA
jgi:NitT/TauT family transport system ATP-binding protein